jgi:hypothetical protein
MSCSGLTRASSGPAVKPASNQSGNGSLKRGSYAMRRPASHTDLDGA